jgi:taurine dioxygenase
MSTRRLGQTKLELTPYPEAFGAELRGLSFETAGEEEAAAVRRVLAQHLLVNVVLDESPDWQDLETFFSRLGTLNARTPEADEHYGILARVQGTSNDDDSPVYVSNAVTFRGDRRPQPGGNDELLWHNDQAWLPRLKKISFLEAIEIPSNGASTFFVDTYAAYDTLPRSLRFELEGKRAVHDSDNVYKRYTGDPDGPRIGRTVVHPVFQLHPDTGRRAVYVNRTSTVSIVGYEPARSDELLAELFDHTYRDEFVYEHRWSEGDFVFWDNVGTQHRRDAVDPTVRRTLRQFKGVSE